MLPEDDTTVSKTCKIVIICEIIEHLLVIVQNNKRCANTCMKINCANSCWLNLLNLLHGRGTIPKAHTVKLTNFRYITVGHLTFRHRASSI